MSYNTSVTRVTVTSSIKDHFRAGSMKAQAPATTTGVTIKEGAAFVAGKLAFGLGFAQKFVRETVSSIAK